jgi:hypothetical protein
MKAYVDQWMQTQCSLDLSIARRYSVSSVMKHIPFTLHDIPSAVLVDKGYSEPVE